jgi:hypothetical protein
VVPTLRKSRRVGQPLLLCWLTETYPPFPQLPIPQCSPNLDRSSALSNTRRIAPNKMFPRTHNSLRIKILPLTCCSPKIFSQNPANSLIAIDQGGGGRSLLCRCIRMRHGVSISKSMERSADRLRCDATGSVSFTSGFRRSASASAATGRGGDAPAFFCRSWRMPIPSRCR